MNENKQTVSRLVMDAAAAKRMGISYGQYIAFHCSTPSDLPLAVTQPEGNRFVCEYCGKVFYRLDNYKPKFCGPICREAAKYQKRKRSKTA